MKKIISFIFFIVAIAIIVLILRNNGLPNIGNNTIDEGPIKKYIGIEFLFTEDDKIFVQYEHIDPPQDLFTITQDIALQQNWEFASEDYGEMGILVEKIKDKENGESKKYWQYFMDLQQPQVSAEKFYPTPGQYIQWKFQASEF
ncbi:DUF4430 domain-containing protein [Candidatus Parcubacteria bacterium]|jgi:hypothetical protein|nr:DUF4430 domain-containing protein [Candidatus Parcubacteria bacterium]MBT7228397.1 DUF4430 domain-containing protein [Candidatus Parcubacteria bacterium]